VRHVAGQVRLETGLSHAEGEVADEEAGGAVTISRDGRILLRIRRVGDVAAICLKIVIVVVIVVLTLVFCRFLLLRVVTIFLLLLPLLLFLFLLLLL